MSFIKTNWEDSIIDVDGTIVQKGTPLSAKNLNRIEDGIVDLNEQVEEAIQTAATDATKKASAAQTAAISAASTDASGKAAAAEKAATDWAKLYGLGGAKQLPSGTDLNDLVTPGDYIFTSGTLINNPHAGACHIKVYNRAGEELPTQEVIPIYKNLKFIRSRSASAVGSPWNPWDSFVTSAAPSWQTPVFQNGWSNGFVDRPVRFAVVGNLLYLRGTIKPGTIGENYPVFTLPIGYRPSEFRMASIPTVGTGSSVSQVNRLHISTNGGVSVAWNNSVEALGIDLILPL